MAPLAQKHEPAPDIFRARFECCFRDHYPHVLAFAIRRMPGREAAEDATAETFAVAWRRRDCIPEPALPWLYAIGLRVIANQRRSSQRRQALGERLAREPEPGTPGLDPVESCSRRDTFAVAFERLSEPEREVLRLVAWDGFDTRDGARALGCSPTAFRVRLHRARRKLARQLEAAGHSIRESPTATPQPAEEIK
jgi:RNA polymerase sigma-70 factor (ECF subfamily)